MFYPRAVAIKSEKYMANSCNSDPNVRTQSTGYWRGSSWKKISRDLLLWRDDVNWCDGWSNRWRWNATKTEKTWLCLLVRGKMLREWKGITCSNNNGVNQRCLKCICHNCEYKIMWWKLCSYSLARIIMTILPLTMVILYVQSYIQQYTFSVVILHPTNIILCNDVFSVNAL